ncbi:hypothetical protein AgCh_005187 [Apium graveolens]
MGSLWRERDTSEAERAQHVKQIHDFQDHMQEKERQFMELQEQFAEFVHTIQALQIELADLRQRNATSIDESRASELNIKDALQSGNNVGNQLNVSGDCQTHDSGTLSNGNFENDLSSKSQGNASGHVGQCRGVRELREEIHVTRRVLEARLYGAILPGRGPDALMGWATEVVEDFERLAGPEFPWS